MPAYPRYPLREFEGITLMRKETIIGEKRWASTLPRSKICKVKKFVNGAQVDKTLGKWK